MRRTLLATSQREKTVNQIRLSILPSTGFITLYKIVNSDDQSKNYKFDYDVTSEVYVMIRMRENGEEYEEHLLLFTPDTPNMNNPQKYLPAGDFVSMRCEPAEDDNYIYEVIITDLRG